ncbi:MAG: glycosyltransferase, partial [Rhodospirillales bacterium]|nr:glycosyltransferase [Rhodospirillales bacterium]
PKDGWSRRNLIADHGPDAPARFPDIPLASYDAGADPAVMVDGAGLVLVHEWTDPTLVARLGRLRVQGGRFLRLFHDTHHRAVSDPDAIRAFDLSGYDGVLAFGAALAEVYRRWGWGDRVFVWHEAADTTLFRPPATEGARAGLVWIGNWGDGERSAELDSYLFTPAQSAGLSLDVWGVRYPVEALATLAARGAHYHGWLPNARVPEAFARHLATVHVPRRYYAETLPGIPTIRVFEALACGIPLASASWQDSEGLFRPGEDFLVARSGAEMTRHLRALAADAGLRGALAANGLACIRARHTCAHRVEELLAIERHLRDGAAHPAPQVQEQEQVRVA